MTTKNMTKLIGRITSYRPDKSPIAFEVEIVDAREVFGREEVQIRPGAGHGSRWVSLDSLTLGR